MTIPLQCRGRSFAHGNELTAMSLMNVCYYLEYCIQSNTVFMRICVVWNVAGRYDGRLRREREINARFKEFVDDEREREGRCGGAMVWCRRVPCATRARC